MTEKRTYERLVSAHDDRAEGVAEVDRLNAEAYEVYKKTGRREDLPRHDLVEVRRQTWECPPLRIVERYAVVVRPS